MTSPQRGARVVGMANAVTALRAGIVIVIAVIIGSVIDANAWLAVILASIAATLDGVDGWIARRRGTSSLFGARFDMEVDALLVMVLAVLAWRLGKAGAWVLASGLLRYLFVAAGWVLPWLQRELVPSLRRKSVCVTQIVGLIVVVAPVVPKPASVMVAAVSLAALIWSFAVDVRWLWERR